MARIAERGLPAVLVLVLFFGLWEVLARAVDVQEWLLPAPSAVFAALGSEAGLLAEGLAVTLLEAAAGFGLALVLGGAMAVGLAWSRWLERGFYPLVIGLQTLPILAITPLLIVWFGAGAGSKVAVVVLICFFPIVVNLTDGLRATDADMVRMARVLGATRWQVLMKLRLPASLPFLFSGLKLAAAAAVVGALVGEWVGSTAGLGYIIKFKGAQFQTATSFAAILLLMALAVLLFGAVKAAERWFLRHHEPKEE